MDTAGNVYVTGKGTFKITPAGVITQIIDADGDGAGNRVELPLFGVAVDTAGNVYVSAPLSDNVFKIAPGGVSDEPPDADGGDGTGDMDATMDDGATGGGLDELPDAAAGDRTGDVDPTVDDGATGGGASPGICSTVAMTGTLLMTVLGLISFIQRRVARAKS